MKKLIVMFLFAMALGFGTAALSEAADEAAAASVKTVTGDLLRIDGDYYVMNDAAGKEVRLHVDHTSTLDGTFKSGDKIEAQATDKDHAVSIKHVQPKM